MFRPLSVVIFRMTAWWNSCQKSSWKYCKLYCFRRLKMTQSTPIGLQLMILTEINVWSWRLEGIGSLIAAPWALPAFASKNQVSFKCLINDIFRCVFCKMSWLFTGKMFFIALLKVSCLWIITAKFWVSWRIIVTCVHGYKKTFNLNQTVPPTSTAIWVFVMTRMEHVTAIVGGTAHIVTFI